MTASDWRRAVIKELQGKEDEVKKALVNGLFPMLPGNMLLSEANAMVPILMAAYELGYIAALPAEKKGDRRNVFDDHPKPIQTLENPSCSELQAIIRQKDEEISRLQKRLYNSEVVFLQLSAAVSPPTSQQRNLQTGES